MAFSRYKGTNSFDRSTPADAGSAILKLTNRILADLQVDNVGASKARSLNAQGVVRNSRSYSDPTVTADIVQRGSHPVYYDPSTILQPAVRHLTIIDTLVDNCRKPFICIPTRITFFYILEKP